MKYVTGSIAASVEETTVHKHINKNKNNTNKN